jgi:hypothetical protein
MITAPHRKVKHGSREYWFSYAEDIINRTRINRPWLSEIKCAEIALGSAVKEGDPKAIELSRLLRQKKKKNDFNMHNPPNSNETSNN